MISQLELFEGRESREFVEWLSSPTGTIAPWVMRERAPKTRRSLQKPQSVGARA